MQTWQHVDACACICVKKSLNRVGLFLAPPHHKKQLLVPRRWSLPFWTRDASTLKQTALKKTLFEKINDLQEKKPSQQAVWCRKHKSKSMQTEWFNRHDPRCKHRASADNRKHFRPFCCNPTAIPFSDENRPLLLMSLIQSSFKQSGHTEVAFLFYYKDNVVECRYGSNINSSSPYIIFPLVIAGVTYIYITWTLI